MISGHQISTGFHGLTGCQRDPLDLGCHTDSFFLFFTLAVQITKFDLMGSCIGFEPIIFAINMDAHYPLKFLVLLILCLYRLLI